MDKALAYRRDVGRNDAARRDADRHTETERLASHRADFDHLIERRMNVHREEAAIRAAMASYRGHQLRRQRRWRHPGVGRHRWWLRSGSCAGHVAMPSRAETAAPAPETDHCPVG
jgi:hypothetical protein